MQCVGMGVTNMTIQEVVKLAAETGAITALSMIDKCADGAMKQTIESVVAEATRAGAHAVEKERVNIRKKEKAKAMDRRMYNTRLLLRNYNSLKAHCESAVYEIATQDDEPAPGEIWDMLNRSIRNEEVYIDSIKRSAMRTMIILRHIERMLDIYAAYCDKSPMQSVKRQYRVLNAKYLIEEPMSVNAIADREHIHPRTVDKDLDAAVECVTALLFGIDAIGGGRLTE